MIFIFNFHILCQPKSMTPSKKAASSHAFWLPLYDQQSEEQRFSEHFRKIWSSIIYYFRPLHASLEKGPTNENFGISNLNHKVHFFQNYNPPYFTSKPNLTDFFNWGGPSWTVFVAPLMGINHIYCSLDSRPGGS